MDLKDIQNNNINLILEKDKVIILEFYTSWCPTCKMLAMVLEEFEEIHPEVFVLQVNADENKELASLYKVNTAPTLLFIYKGKLYETLHGFIEIEELEEIVGSIEINK